ncbi:MAG TPA: ABC transporter permease [Planctomycetota bacterium]|nr:ABC transporter permease [Planctomycetota bacterium]
MRKVWLVARREYTENVKTKAFLVGLLLTPAIVALGLVLPRLVEKKGGPDEVVVAVADRGTGLFDGLARKAAAHNALPGARPRYRLEAEEGKTEGRESIESRLTERVRRKELTSCLLLDPGIVEGEGGASYFTIHAGLFEVPRTLEGWLNEVVRDRRMREKNVDAELLAYVQKRVALDENVIGREAKPGKGRKEEALGTIFAPMGFVILLFIGIMTVGQGCLTSLIEEKSNRIVEVVLASLSPFQFMTGKILGMGLVGLTLLSVWGAGGYTAAVAGGAGRFVAPENLAFLLAYFTLGFFLYAALFCAIGSACNTLKEAQNLMGPLTLLFVLPWILLIPIARDPNGTLATALSYFPFFTPFVMMARLASSPRPGGIEVVLSLLALAAGVLLVMRAAGKIFRVGILMYGKPPRPRELLRWMRAR